MIVQALAAHLDGRRAVEARERSDEVLEVVRRGIGLSAHERVGVGEAGSDGRCHRCGVGDRAKATREVTEAEQRVAPDVGVLVPSEREERRGEVSFTCTDESSAACPPFGAAETLPTFSVPCFGEAS